MARNQFTAAIVAGVIVLGAALGTGEAFAAPEHATVTHTTDAGSHDGELGGGTDW